MAKTSSKRISKPAFKSTPKSAEPPKAGPPAPYSTPPPVLRPFLETLNAAHIYIIHVDKHSILAKRRAFIVPLVMNIVIAILLIWRAQVAIPTYIALILAALGHDSKAKIDVATTDAWSLVYIAGTRTAMLFMDWALARFMVPWPLDFVMRTPESPLSWRWKLGFQGEEVVVRKSRKWDEDLKDDWLAEDTDGLVYQERIMPAINRTWVQTKTGYLMMDRSWDLDFGAMIAADDLVKKGKTTLADFQKTVIVYSEAHGWLVWPVWKLDEGHEEEGRKKIVLFKDKLTGMGKENLFFRWIELIQYETSQPGGFTPERQADAMKKAEELFVSQGVNFEQFWAEVGGTEGLPGMEKNR